MGDRAIHLRFRPSLQGLFLGRLDGEARYVVYMGDYRNYGYSSREPAMDEPATKNQPVSRSYLALRGVDAMVNHIKRTHNSRR
jgi:hypothetical protein